MKKAPLAIRSSEYHWGESLISTRSAFLQRRNSGTSRQVSNRGFLLRSRVPFALRAALIVLIAAAQVSCSDTEALAARPPVDKRHPALVAHMDRVSDADFISVVIHLDEAIGLQPPERFAVLDDAVGATPRHRRLDGRRRLIDALRLRSGRTQDNLLAALDAGRVDGHVRKVRRLWMLNAVGCEARKSFLNTIIGNVVAMERVADDGIRLDLPRRVVGGTTSSRDDTEISWNIQKIGVESLSVKGVEGVGAVVAVIDLGFEVLHPDLEDRIWTNLGEDADGDGAITAADQDGLDTDGNGYVDDFAGWNFEDQNSTISDTSLHGTGVAGIVAGTGAGGTRTGVAPGAKLMLLRVGDDLNDYATQQQVWDAMQYAADQNADIVNLSLKWRDDYNPDLPVWREKVDLLIESEILCVTIAGNDADQMFAPPYSITTPGRVPNALTVGAVDQNDALWFETGSTTIGSNTGPVTWQFVPGFMDYPYPPGLMKPDVVAPGVGVKTTYKPNPAEIRYRIPPPGTSYAAPHVSGLAALLLQKDTDLGPYELRYLIEESAVDLPASGLFAGPDVNFGWGRVDAPAAFALLPIDPTPYDLSITPTGAEWTTIDIWVDNDDDGIEDTPIATSENHLYARVRNRGGQVVGSVQLVFYYADVATIGIGGFDPNGDGDPKDGSFIYIGSYTIPLLGPAGSDHAEAIGLVNWEILLPTSDHWCVGVAALVNQPNEAEVDISNNIAFRNFFEMLVMTSQNFGFLLTPPPGQENQPFDLVIRRPGVPAEAQLFLRVDEALVPAFEEAAIELPGGKHRITRDDSRDFTLFPLEGEVVRFRNIRAPNGESMPISLSVRVPPEVRLPQDARVVLSVHDADDRPAGGLTVNLERGSSRQRGGPYHPIKRH